MATKMAEKRKNLLPHLTLCADDFGLNSAVNAGIIHLVKAGHLNAVSCMSGGAAFESGIPALLKACEEASIEVEIGLHLTLTEYTPLTTMKKLAPRGKLPALALLLIKSHLGWLDRGEVRDEIAQQWERFEAIAGRTPDFMDGHQHSHLLPEIRDEVIELAKAKFQKKCWVRGCYAPLSPLRKSGRASWRLRIINHLANEMIPLLKEAKIKTNPFFYGVNSFKKDEKFEDHMDNWVNLAKANKEWAVIMCHPGLKSEDDTILDPISARRVDELEALLRKNYINN